MKTTMCILLSYTKNDCLNVLDTVGHYNEIKPG